MIDKREALEALRKRFVERSGWVPARCDDGQILMAFTPDEYDTIRASLEQKAEPVCRVVFNGNQYGIQDMNGNAFDMSKWPNTTLYATPPSTAEVEARALEAYAQRMDEAGVITSLDDQMVTRLLDEAKRIREQSND